MASERAVHDECHTVPVENCRTATSGTRSLQAGQNYVGLTGDGGCTTADQKIYVAGAPRRESAAPRRAASILMWTLMNTTQRGYVVALSLIHI